MKALPSLLAGIPRWELLYKQLNPAPLGLVALYAAAKAN
jgi:hypothetical protein